MVAILSRLLTVLGICAIFYGYSSMAQPGSNLSEGRGAPASLDGHVDMRCSMPMAAL